jgi:transcription elongation GreA/GreB family factor
MEISYDLVIKSLESKIDAITDELRIEGNEELLNEKLQFSKVIKWLRTGMNFQINPDSKVTVLPEQTTSTPSSEFRIIEDHESDMKEYWSEIKPNGDELRPSPGDFIIENWMK